MLVKLNGIAKLNNEVLIGQMDEITRKNTMNMIDNLNSFTNLFSETQKNKMEQMMLKNVEINFLTNYSGEYSPILSDVEKIKFDKISGWKIRMNLNVSTSDFIRKHELWHTLLFPIDPLKMQSQIIDNELYTTGHGCIYFVKDSLEKYSRTGKITDLYEFGIALEEGMANIIAILASIKEKAKKENNVELLKEADKYLETGELGPNFNCFRGYYVILEDITRLMILASRNDYLLPHPLSEVLNSNEGLDGVIEFPVNKPYCSIISSAVNGNFDFQKEFDEYIKEYNMKYNENFPYYIQICAWIKNTQFENIQKSNSISSFDQWSLIVDTIEKYYFMKLNKLRINKVITEQKAVDLFDRFEKSVQIVKERIKRKCYKTNISL